YPCFHIDYKSSPVRPLTESTNISLPSICEKKNALYTSCCCTISISGFLNAWYLCITHLITSLRAFLTASSVVSTGGTSADALILISVVSGNMLERSGTPFTRSTVMTVHAVLGFINVRGMVTLHKTIKYG